MARLTEADFYYGAILSTLLNKGIWPIIIEGGDNRRIYEYTSDHDNFIMFTKYRSSPINTKDNDYMSWQFLFSEKDIIEIKSLLSSKKRFSLGLVCGVPDLNKSEYAVIPQEIMSKIMALGKTSITISRKKGEHNYRVHIGGGRDNSIQIKANVLY